MQYKAGKDVDCQGHCLQHMALLSIHISNTTQAGNYLVPDDKVG